MTGAVIAALYTALCLALPALSYGTVQVRFSEALTLLPVLMPGGLMGVTLGCFLTNLVGAFLGTNILGALDVLFGTLATLIAAVLTYRIKGSLWLKALPPVLVNAMVVGLVLTYAYGLNTLLLNMLTVGAGEAVVCYALGVPMMKLLNRADLSRFTGRPHA